jgi:hypothetical protein
MSGEDLQRNPAALTTDYCLRRSAHGFFPVSLM